jgi:hypothetical protein
MSAQSRSVVMVGLPASGKSTYLGALFHTLKSGADGIQMDGLPVERDYLIELERDWLSMKPLGRSAHHGARNVELPLAVPDQGGSLTLSVPDVVGESYQQAWEHGYWDAAVRGYVETADALLLFVRANAVVPAELIEVRRSASSSASKLAPWSPTQSPTQAILCDLLEQIGEMRGEGMLPLAVVVSAWDKVAELGLSPSHWLAWQLPLLTQWLSARTPAVMFRVFGVSAQGGDLEDESIRRQVAADAGHRPIPAGGSAIAAPLQWLLEQT